VRKTGEILTAFWLFLLSSIIFCIPIERISDIVIPHPSTMGAIAIKGNKMLLFVNFCVQVSLLH
jgi:hypothetical protein